MAVHYVSHKGPACSQLTPKNKDNAPVTRTVPSAATNSQAVSQPHILTETTQRPVDEFHCTHKICGNELE